MTNIDKEQKILDELKVAKKELEQAREKRTTILRKQQIAGDKYDETLMALNDVKNKFDSVYKELMRAEEKNRKAWPEYDKLLLEHSMAWREYKTAREKFQSLSNKLEELRK